MFGLLLAPVLMGSNSWAQEPSAQGTITQVLICAVYVEVAATLGRMGTAPQIPPAALAKLTDTADALTAVAVAIAVRKGEKDRILPVLRELRAWRDNFAIVARSSDGAAFLRAEHGGKCAELERDIQGTARNR